MRHLREAIRAIVLNGGGVTPDKGRARHLARFARTHQNWWTHRNVVGICIAQKRRGGELGAPCVQVLVKQKLAPGKLTARQQIPGFLESPAFSRRIPTDVRAVGALGLESLVTEKRPARPGFDIGNRLGGSGTLGCVVVDGAGRRLGLSCAHVLAPEGTDDVDDPIGGIVLCPSLTQAEGQGVMAQAPIGRLVKVLPPSFDPGDAATNLDAALFLPTDGKALDARIADLNVKPTGINDAVKLNTVVRKVGASTGETHGVVQAINGSYKMPYEGGLVVVVDHIAISTFTEPGDSGALVIDDQNRAVGLHLGAAQGLSICTPIRRVLDALSCTLA